MQDTETGEGEERGGKSVHWRGEEREHIKNDNEAKGWREDEQATGITWEAREEERRGEDA